MYNPLQTLIAMALLLAMVFGIAWAVSLSESMTERSAGEPGTRAMPDTTKMQEEVIPSPDSFPPGFLIHQIWAEEVHDTPLHTYVRLQIIVSGNITREGLENLLRELFQDIRNRKFKYHEHPRAQIAAYTSKGRAESALWIALLNADGADAYPEILFDDRQLELLGQEPETRFGFTERQRMAIYQEIVQVEDRAWADAMKKYPDLDPGAPAELGRKRAFKQIGEKNRLLNRYKGKLAAKYGLTREQLDEIGYEGADEHWPMPPMV